MASKFGPAYRDFTSTLEQLDKVPLNRGAYVGTQVGTTEHGVDVEIGPHQSMGTVYVARYALLFSGQAYYDEVNLPRANQVEVLLRRSSNPAWYNGAKDRGPLTPTVISLAMTNRRGRQRNLRVQLTTAKNGEPKIDRFRSGLVTFFTPESVISAALLKASSALKTGKPEPQLVRGRRVAK